MELSELRSRYLEFFKARGHTVIPSASLIPANDPTTLFTGSGMQPLLPYLLGKNHPEGSRITDSQKCFRAIDIEEVGDNRHTTFFEMLGNWSLGDYFKKDQLTWFYEFLTVELKIPKEKLWVTCFEGDPKLHLPKDIEAADIWKSLGVSEDHIRFYKYKNWWSRAGEPKNMPVGEPGGGDSEVFYEFAHIEHDPAFGFECHPNCDCGRFMEIGNSVFMEYVKKEDGTFGPLPKNNIDFGGGLERIAAAMQNDPDLFQIPTMHRLIDDLEHFSGKNYGNNTRAFRIIADHMRAAIFLTGAGVFPSNSEKGYFVRRLLRRSIRFSNELSIPANSLSRLVDRIADDYEKHYEELKSRDAIKKVIDDEEKKFRETLERGMKMFEKMTKGTSISGQDAYILFTTHGFPFELVQEIARERGLSVDESAFKAEMRKHQELSRAGSEQKFKGGLADASPETTRLHTAHHLLLKALQIVLGSQVKQKGSNITRERLRIDFSHGEKVTKEQLTKVEEIVNEMIKEALPVIRSTLPKSEAEKLGAEQEFGAKYPEMVSVYSVGPREATEANPQFDEAFSIEFCGGPHVENTSEIGALKILKEEASSAGVRRIKAVLTK